MIRREREREGGALNLTQIIKVEISGCWNCVMLCSVEIYDISMMTAFV